MKQLKVEMGKSMEMGTIYAGDFLMRICSHLSMTNQAVKAAQEAVQKSEPLDIRLGKTRLLSTGHFLTYIEVSTVCGYFWPSCSRVWQSVLSTMELLTPTLLKKYLVLDQHLLS